MIDNFTKFLILAMTAVVIFTMSYLLNAQKFLDEPDAMPELVSSDKQNNISDGRKRIQDLANQYAPTIQTPKSIRTGNVIKVGISLPSLDDMEVFGNSVKTSLSIAESEIPSNTRFRYEVIVKESQKNNLKMLEENIENLINVDNVNALLSVSGDSEVVAKLAEEHNIPHITCSMGNDFLKDYKNTFNHYPRNETLVTAFFDNLEKEDIKIISVVAIDKKNILEFVSEIEKQAIENGVRVVSKNIVKEGQRDYKVEIKDIKKVNPELVLTLLPQEELNIFATLLNNTRLKFKYGSIEFFKSFNNRFLINDAIFVSASEGGTIFQDKFRDATILPNYTCSMNMYDALKLYVVAFEASKKTYVPDGKEVVKNISRIGRFVSGTGELISSDNNHQFDTKPLSFEIKNGKLIHR